MNAIGQQVKAYESPLPTMVMTDKKTVYTKYQIQVLEIYMYVDYVICKAFNKAYIKSLIN